MQYECPACKMKWQDTLEPLDQISFPTCIFCSQPHSQKELLNWQIQHLSDIDPKYFSEILKNVFLYFDNEIKILEEKLDG